MISPAASSVRTDSHNSAETFLHMPEEDGAFLIRTEIGDRQFRVIRLLDRVSRGYAVDIQTGYRLPIRTLDMDPHGLPRIQCEVERYRPRVGGRIDLLHHVGPLGTGLHGQKIRVEQAAQFPPDAWVR